MREDELPYDVAQHEVDDLDYNWRQDAYECYLLAYRIKALIKGSARFETLPEMYLVESVGGIP